MGAILALVLSTTAPAAQSAVAPAVTAEQWRTVEISLTASAQYQDPFTDVQVTATFHGPSGATVTRPAFWDGGSTWKVRFAPPVVGDWTMTTAASNMSDTGLHGVSRSVRAVRYTGDLAIYRHGFLTTSADGHHLEHADGTPFLYLGDTHWILPHERFGSSNAPGVASQFRYVVDKRVDQGFTVYQSEPIWQPHGASDLDAETHHGPDEEPVADLTDGMQAADLPGFTALDRKFAYVADAGLVHANAMIAWVGQPAAFPGAMSPDFMARAARYWNARYGSYPAIWTVGQEIDDDFYGRYAGSAMAPWTAAIEELDRVDDYDQPIAPHQENIGSTTSNNSRFAAEPWHDAFAAQWQSTDGWPVQVAKDYWDTGKPTVNYETPYEDFWTDGRHALSAFYKSYLLGMRGYGYGVAGVWNDVYSAPGQPLDAGTAYELPARYQWWYTGANRPTADQLTFGVDFFRSLRWWDITPRFDDDAWSDFASGDDFLASDGNRTYVALFADGTTRTGRLKGLDPRRTYTATWFDPRTGTRTLIDDSVEAPDGSWAVPAKPTADDWVLLVERGRPLGPVPGRPVIEPADHDYTRAQDVTIRSSTPRAELRYTTDGTVPTSASPRYSGPIRVSDPAGVTVQALAITSNHQSSVATAVFRHSLPDVAAQAAVAATSSAPGSAPGNVVDRDPATRWQPAEGGEARLDLSYPSATVVDTILLTGAGTVSYRVEYSEDGAWRTADEGTMSIGPTGNGSVLTFPQVTTRELRLVLSPEGGSGPLSVNELGTYYDRDRYPDLTVGGAYSASSSWDANQTAEKAFDGSADTNWQACDQCWAGQWLEVDFGRQTTFDEVAVSEYGNRTTGYRIEYWNDGAWHSAHAGTSGFGQQGETTTVSFDDVTGTKARIHYLSGTANAPIVYEFSIYRRT